MSMELGVGGIIIQVCQYQCTRVKDFPYSASIF